ncbi:T9SS type A sorting domain-containing protein [Tellurirhabdus bombi]|uniref:T9SS type A sorting domain-containing protein n=1 Tax=Tellurirhabdus bombi TaxID=2907205 RepID=UPI001F2C2036|nr:T9SS type A sorting domain-containing protein [Tellurirhabdus bombi]
MLFFTLAVLPALGQEQCSEPFVFQPVSTTNSIGWDKFPAFKLPFQLIYGGPRLGEAAFAPLQRGFSQLTRLRNDETSANKSQQAIDYYGVAYGLNQPWETLESPWGNDTALYRSQWENWLKAHSIGKDTLGRWFPGFSTLMLDYERVLETDPQILRLKANPQTPAQYRQLPDTDFLKTYKRDMVDLYAEAIRFLRQKGDFSGVKVTAYSDVPVRNTYLNVVGNSWQDWTTNLTRVNFLFKDSTETKIGGAFHEQLDFLQPSIYYYYDYPNPLAGDYLAYLLFQVEVNRNWSSKPVHPIAWMRYHDCCGSYPKFIQPFMAEASAIFPFFAGAKGLWLWEEPNFRDAERPMAAYEHFIHGLYRLSTFADMFEGTYELVAETPAPELMDKRLPVWRGVFKNNKLLVAAQNPYANDNEKTPLTVRYKNWSTQITLTGKETYLCKFDLSVIVGLEPESTAGLSVSPNPAFTHTTIQYTTANSPTVDVQLINLAGQLLKSQKVRTSSGAVQLEWDMAPFPTGLHIIRVQDGQKTAQKKLLITR